MFSASDILAGPILRRVEQDLVSVWIALTVPADVTLAIYNGVGESGSLGLEIKKKPPADDRDYKTLAVGKGLHIAVAIWEPAEMAGLQWGGLYSYDVKITPDGGAEIGLKDLGLLTDNPVVVGTVSHPHLALGYQANWLPSFALPPANLRDLKMIQGSCRGTNGHGRDAMAPIDDLLRTLITDPKARPHQMHLTGDQIYADEGAPELVEIINKATGQWLGGDATKCFERLRVEFPATTRKATDGTDLSQTADAFSIPVDIRHFPPSKRGHLIIEVAHFTSDHTDSHAMSFGEYCGTYLTGWCNVPWGDWNGLNRLATAKTRFNDYVQAVTNLHQASWKSDFSSMAVLGLPSQKSTLNTPDKILRFLAETLGLTSKTPVRDAIDKMIRYFAAWRLLPAAYRSIDFFLQPSDLEIAWGKHSTDENAADSIMFDLWKNWSTANSLAQALPVDSAQAPITDEPLSVDRMNRLARALTPSWFTGQELFEVSYDVNDDGTGKPAVKPKGSEEFNRIHRLQWCYEDLPKVRRVLANIPTYMIFDDHEVTDDWNITYKWQKLTRGNALGRSVTRNALAAFTIFQYWGNNPRACRKGNIQSDVLDKIEAMFAKTRSSDAPDSDPEKLDPPDDVVTWLEKAFDLTLLPDTPVIGGSGPITPGVPSDPAERMRWDFRYDGPQFEVLALDSRTWRGAETDANDLLKEPFYDDASATLMTDQAMRLQIPEQPGTPEHPGTGGINPKGICFVIAAAPFLGFPPVESVAQPLINIKDMLEREPRFPFKRWKRSLLFGRVEHDPEPWGYRPALFEAILARLNSRNRVIFYSGDVHYSFASHMNYWQLDPATGNSKQATRFVQLTASSFRAQQPQVASVFALDLLQQLGALASKTSRRGWHRGVAGTANFQAPIKPGATPFNQHVTQALLDDPILVSPDGLPTDTNQVRKPDWVWEMDLDYDKRPDSDRFDVSMQIPDFSNADHGSMVQSVARRHSWEARTAMARRWFWWTNFTLVGFQPDANGDPGTVVFQVYSFDPDGREPDAKPFLTALIDLTVKPQPDQHLVGVM